MRAILGKHPGWGDFLRLGWPEGAAERLERWIDGTMGSLRDEGIWDVARPVRFALGGALVGMQLRGVLWFSRDKVGRRHPLILVEAGGDDPTDQAPWEALEAALPEAGSDLSVAFAGVTGTPDSAVVWAVNDEGDIAAMFDAAARAEPAAAAATRSHWWRAGAPAVWLSVPGLPDAEACRFLMGGAA